MNTPGFFLALRYYHIDKLPTPMSSHASCMEASDRLMSASLILVYKTVSPCSKARLFAKKIGDFHSPRLVT